ncbi:MAG: GGDEF domain-containing protein, partial [Candidatus Eisenbacteria bacterium]|nr:GGDEF domain-containing protein [Candidatus Eisenbacteria bacterium]
MSGSSIQLSRLAIEKNPDHVVMLGVDLTVKEASVTFTEATQGKPGENFTSFLDPFTVTAVDKFFGQLKTAEDVSDTCQMHHRVGDRSVPVEYTWVRCDDESGKAVGFFGIGRDSDPRMSSADGDDMVSELEHARSEVTRMKHELDGLRRQVDNHSFSDVLTGLGNRRFVMDRLNTELPRAIRYDEPLTVLLMDIDHLGRINDEHGHDLGDTVIREVAEMVRQQVRTTDSVAR